MLADGALHSVGKSSVFRTGTLSTTDKTAEKLLTRRARREKPRRALRKALWFSSRLSSFLRDLCG
jgi:hypothetical protein